MATDIQNLPWLPSTLRPYGILMRLDRPIGWWLLLLPGWWAIMLAGNPYEARTWVMMGLFWVGAVIMRGAGCVVNDLYDRDLDARVERTRTRPLVSGAVSVKQACIFLLGLFLLGLVILLQLPLFAVLLGVATLPFILAYPLMKRITWWPQLFLGFTFNFGALIGWAAIAGGLDWPALILYLAGIIWTLSYDTVYACMDRADDRMVGIKSTALRFGVHTKKYVTGFHMTAMILAACAIPLSWISGLFLLPLTVGLWWIKRWDVDDERRSLHLFKRQRDIGLMITVILLVWSL